jgi:hypothetical protein
MKPRILFGVLMMLVFSTIVVAQQVSVNYVHNKSFAQYHTYAWGGDQSRLANSILGQEAQADINAQLQTKGLQMVQENQNPDLIVTAGGGAQQQTSYSAWGGWGWGQITPEQSVEGTLIVNIYDANAKSLVWRGIAEKTLEKSGSKNQKNVDKAIEKMFKQWPKQ